MIKVEPFKAKLVREPKTRETGKGPVCNLRVLQIDPGKPPFFITVAVFGKELAEKCSALLNGAELEISDVGLIFKEWEAKPKGKGKPQKRSGHSMIAKSITVA